MVMKDTILVRRFCHRRPKTGLCYPSIPRWCRQLFQWWGVLTSRGGNCPFISLDRVSGACSRPLDSWGRVTSCHSDVLVTCRRKIRCAMMCKFATALRNNIHLPICWGVHQLGTRTRKDEHLRVSSITLTRLLDLCAVVALRHAAHVDSLRNTA